MHFWTGLKNFYYRIQQEGVTLRSREAFADAFAEIEAKDVFVTEVTINATRFKELRLWTVKDFQPVTRRELLVKGYIGDLWGATVRFNNKVGAPDIVCK